MDHLIDLEMVILFSEEKKKYGFINVNSYGTDVTTSFKKYCINFFFITSFTICGSSTRWNLV